MNNQHINFKEFMTEFENHFEEMVGTAESLFIVEADRDEMWETYLESFPPRFNQIFREKREMDCSCCRSFIKRMANIVTITDDNELVTLWDFELDDPKYGPMLKAMSQLIHRAHITNAFITKENHHGTSQTLELLDNNNTIEWNHFDLSLPSELVNNSRKPVNAIMAERRATRQVFERSLNEITKSALETTLGLIAEKTLYRGEEWKQQLEKFSKLRKEFRKVSADKHNNYLWRTSVDVGPVIGRIRNHSIGVLLEDLSSAVDIITADIIKAVNKFEKVVAPSNYKRPKEILTEQMITEADELARANRDKKDKILEAIQAKKNKNLQASSIEESKDMLNEL